MVQEPKLKFLLLILLEKIIEQLLNEISIGSVSDGKIFVSEVIQAYDIGTKNKNELAI